jgi:beta-glucosidase
MNQMRFPKGFIIGTSTAAYQIEGASSEDGRGPSIWDRFSHVPGNIANGHTGDDACDHYHRYKQDVALMKAMGVNGYRMSVSWSRVLPEGKGKINSRGLDFYNRLVDTLAENDITPMVTLYHWDLPQALQELGGWGNRDTADYFAEYADIIYRTLGDRVKYWNTLNEPWVSAYAGHYHGRHAPGATDFKLAVQVSHHLMLAHAKAVEVYRGCDHKDGKMGIALNLYPVYPASPDQKDYETVLRVDGYHNRWFLDPVLKGCYPQDILTLYQKHYQVPEFAPDDMKTIASQKVDFLGVNYYMRKVVRYLEASDLLHYEETLPKDSKYTDMNWEIYPQGMYDLLKRIQKDYDDPHMIITENGCAFKDTVRQNGVILDDDRKSFLEQHLNTALRAISDGIRLDGYFIWSLLDNFEWAHGYEKRFGLFYTDYATQDRLYKKSGLWLKDYIQNHL